MGKTIKKGGNERLTSSPPSFLLPQTPTIAYAAGIRGEITRELAPKYNAFLTYAPLHDSPHGHSEADWAPPTVQDLLEVYLLHSIHPASLVFGVCANPVGHSKSPLLLNAAMVETGVDGVYVPFLVDAIEEFFDTFDDFAGFRCEGRGGPWGSGFVVGCRSGSWRVLGVLGVLRSCGFSCPGYLGLSASGV